MTNNYKNALDLSYNKYVQYLLKKYGTATEDYFSEYSYNRFLNNKIKTLAKNRKVSRTSEGLYTHHIDEDKQILIANQKAIKFFNIPFAYQTADRLVYCNLIEHAILHIHIAIEQKNNQPNRMLLGIGGYTDFIRPELIDLLINENKPIISNTNQQWRQNCYNAIYMPKAEFQILLSQMDNKLINNYPITPNELNVKYENYKNKQKQYS